MNARDRKAAKYTGLVAELQEINYHCTYYSIEIGSRGIAAQGTCRIIKELCNCSRKDARLFVQSLIKLVLKCSYVIFREKDNPCVVSLPVIK